MLKGILAKLGLRKHADEDSYGAETTRKETRRDDARDALSDRPRAGDSPPQSREEPPARAE